MASKEKIYVKKHGRTIHGNFYIVIRSANGDKIGIAITYKETEAEVLNKFAVGTEVSDSIDWEDCRYVYSNAKTTEYMKKIYEIDVDEIDTNASTETIATDSYIRISNFLKDENIGVGTFNFLLKYLNNGDRLNISSKIRNSEVQYLREILDSENFKRYQLIQMEIIHLQNLFQRRCIERLLKSESITYFEQNLLVDLVKIRFKDRLNMNDHKRLSMLINESYKDLNLELVEELRRIFTGMDLTKIGHTSKHTDSVSSGNNINEDTNLRDDIDSSSNRHRSLDESDIMRILGTDDAERFGY